MGRWFDPTPSVEKEVPKMRGIASSDGFHGQTIPVLWQGKIINAKVIGNAIISGSSVSVVGIASQWFAINGLGSYRSTEKRQLQTWKNKGKPASLAIRKLMEKNPKKYLYMLEKVFSFDQSSHTATLFSGEEVPVKFGFDPPGEDARISDDEMALVSCSSYRHVIGRKNIILLGAFSRSTTLYYKVVTGGEILDVEYNYPTFTLASKAAVFGARAWRKNTSVSEASIRNTETGDIAPMPAFGKPSPEEWAYETPGWGWSGYDLVRSYSPYQIAAYTPQWWKDNDFTPPYMLLPAGTYEVLGDGVVQDCALNIEGFFYE